MSLRDSRAIHGQALIWFENAPHHEWQGLEETTVLQVILYDDVGHGVEDELHVLGVGGAGEVGVDFLRVFPLIQVLKLTLNIGSCLFVCV